MPLPSNNSALYDACSGNNKAAVLELLKKVKSADLEYAGLNGHSPLSIACFRGNLEIVQLLLSQPNIKPAFRNNNFVDPLRIACEKGYVEIVWELLNKGYDLNDENLEDPLICAAEHPDVMKLLLAQPKINVNVASKKKQDGQSFFHKLLYNLQLHDQDKQRPFIEIVKIVIDKQVDLATYSDPKIKSINLEQLFNRVDDDILNYALENGTGAAKAMNICLRSSCHLKPNSRNLLRRKLYKAPNSYNIQMQKCPIIRERNKAKILAEIARSKETGNVCDFASDYYYLVLGNNDINDIIAAIGEQNIDNFQSLLNAIFYANSVYANKDHVFKKLHVCPDPGKHIETAMEWAEKCHDNSTKLFNACRAGNIEPVNRLLKEEILDVNCFCFNDGNQILVGELCTPLDIAFLIPNALYSELDGNAAESYLSIAKLLLADGRLNINAHHDAYPERRGMLQILLEWDVNNTKILEILKLLINNGIDINRGHFRSQSRFEPLLMTLIYKDRKDIWEKLLNFETIDPNVMNCDEGGKQFIITMSDVLGIDVLKKIITKRLDLAFFESTKDGTEYYQILSFIPNELLESALQKCIRAKEAVALLLRTRKVRGRGKKELLQKYLDANPLNETQKISVEAMISQYNKSCLMQEMRSWTMFTNANNNDFQADESLLHNYPSFVMHSIDIKKIIANIKSNQQPLLNAVFFVNPAVASQIIDDSPIVRTARESIGAVSRQFLNELTPTKLAEPTITDQISRLSHYAIATPPCYSGVGIQASLSQDRQSLTILSVAAGGAVDKAGISAGSITHINGFPIASLFEYTATPMRKMINLMRFGNEDGKECGIGKNVTITVEGKERLLNIGLIETEIVRGKFSACEVAEPFKKVETGGSILSKNDRSKTTGFK